MAKNEIFVPMVQEALEFHDGSATVKQVAEYIADNYQDVINEDDDLRLSWQYDFRWAATLLRKDGIMLPAKESPKGVWELANSPNSQSVGLTLDSILHSNRGDEFESSDLFKLFTGDLFGNTPQKGIHWYPKQGPLEFIVINSTTGSTSKYQDRYIDEGMNVFLYYLMISKRHSHNSEINYNATENSILLNQDTNGAQILLLLRENDRSPYTSQGWFVMETHCHDDRKHHEFVDSILLIRSD